MRTLIKNLKTLTRVLIVSFGLIYVSALFAATPNPGHPWKEVGDGFWAATGTTGFRTFTFPNATATVLTTFTPVTVLQGGTGQTSTSSALNVLTGDILKGDLFIRGASIFGRLALGTNNYVLTSSSSQPLGITWAPLLVSPAGSNTYIQFNDAGNNGASASFTYDKTSSTLGLNGMINLTDQTDPSAPPTDILTLYAKKISGRSMLKAIGPSGVDYAYQPSFFQNAMFIVSTGASTALTTIGNTLTSVGTISHVVSEPLGYMANFVTANSAGSTAGTGGATAPYFIGSQQGSNGFFFQTRMAFPDATSTGIRAFVGFTDGTMAASVSADNPTGNFIGWQYSTSRSDTGWKFMTKNGTTQTVTSTILPMATNQVFDFFIYCPPYPNNTVIYYRVDNVTAGTTAEGTTSSTLPLGSTALRAGFQISNVNNGGRNVRLSRLYVETDK